MKSEDFFSRWVRANWEESVRKCCKYSFALKFIPLPPEHVLLLYFVSSACYQTKLCWLWWQCTQIFSNKSTVLHETNFLPTLQYNEVTHTWIYGLTQSSSWSSLKITEKRQNIIYAWNEILKKYIVGGLLFVLRYYYRYRYPFDDDIFCAYFVEGFIIIVAFITKLFHNEHEHTLALPKHAQ